MKETMFDVLVYLFENYLEAEIQPDQSTLTRELSAAGFESAEIDGAFAWLTGLETLAEAKLPASLGASLATRCYADAETRVLNAECRGFIYFLEASKVLNPIQREWVIDRAQALSEREINLEQLKWIVLIVLWSQRQTQDYLFVEDILFSENKPQMH